MRLDESAAQLIRGLAPLGAFALGLALERIAPHAALRPAWRANLGLWLLDAMLKAGDHDYHLHVVEAHNTGPSTMLTMSAYVALCSAMVGKALERQMVVLGSMSLGGNIVPVENLAALLAGPPPYAAVERTG